MADGVEGPAVHARARRSHEPLCAREHFGGGAAGERKEEDALRGDAAIHEGSHSMNESARLPGARSGDDEKWRVAECDRSRLIRVERGGELLLVGGGEIPLPRTVEARLVGHEG